jgi:imidazole glycerol-phosphate synthase subunit HisH
MIVIIDYGMGNLRSVQKKFQQVGAKVEITSNINIISKAEKLILPGVGHFENGVKKLKEYGIWDVLQEKVIVGKIPILGICLGMQLMATYSEEGNVEGFGWIDADVIKFKIQDKLKYKVPHMGWNNAEVRKDSTLFLEVPNDSMFYFVHSYHIRCNNKSDILTTSEYEYKFTSAIQKDNIFGTQFHPEKSHGWGEKVFSNFMNYV